MLVGSSFCRVAATALAVVVAGCSPSFPSEHFPPGIEVKRTLFAGGGGIGAGEGCEAFVVELTDRASKRLIRVKKVEDRVELVPPSGWYATPVARTDQPRYYEGAFGGCNDDGIAPLGDLPGWLNRPGAFYRVINGGEGIAIIVPRAKMAGFYYFG